MPIPDRDFHGYLYPALLALTGHPFQHIGGRAFLYPWLIYQLLAATQDFRSIAIVQHGLGLLAGLLLWGIWGLARRALRETSIPRWSFDLLGFGMLFFYLFEAQPIQFELLIRPDAVCPFFACLSFFLLTAFLVAWRLDGSSERTAIYGGLALFVALVLPSLKPSYWLSSVFTSVPVFCAIFDRRGKRWSRLLMIAGPVVAAYLLLFLPEKRFSSADSRSDSFLPESVFTIHGMIIREQLAEDVAHPDPSSPYTTEELRNILAWMDSGIAEAHRTNPRQMETLGYDADWLLYHDPFFQRILEMKGWGREKELEFCRYYYRRAWQRKPVPMLGKIAVQLGQFYNLNCPAYCDHGYHLEKYYRDADELLRLSKDRALNEACPPTLVLRDSMSVLKSQETPVSMPKSLRPVANWLGNLYFPLLIAWFASLPVVLWSADFRRKFGLAAAIVGVGYAFNFGNNLGIAILHTLQISRYTYIQFATTLITEALTIAFLAEALAVVGQKVRGKVRTKSDSDRFAFATDSER